MYLCWLVISAAFKVLSKSSPPDMVHTCDTYTTIRVRKGQCCVNVQYMTRQFKSHQYNFIHIIPTLSGTSQ